MAQKNGRKPLARREDHSELFLGNMDRRFKPAQVMRRRYELLTTDLGGIEELSYQQRSLCRRVVMIEKFMDQWETKIAEERFANVPTTEYFQSVNCLIGLFKQLGLKRAAKEVRNLATVLKQPNNQAKSS